MISFAIDQIFALIGFAFLILLAASIIAPLESLGWWAGWSGKKPRLDALLDLAVEADQTDLSVPEKNHYLIYLSGIGVASAEGLANDEIDFINHLHQALPNAQIITNVFPYSVNNNPLTGERALTPLWRKVRAIQAKNPESLLAMILINVRNLLQVAVSADPRYGPIYSLGVAKEIARSLAQHGYRLGSGKPVYLLGFSGGGQVSVGSATYLSPLINAPVHIISIGGVISDDPGIKHVSKLTHLFGQKDPFQKVGAILWSGRWPVMRQSDWNRARLAGKISYINMGPMAHNMLGGYYDLRVSLPDGRTYCAATAQTVKQIIAEGENG